MHNTEIILSGKSLNTLKQSEVAQNTAQTGILKLKTFSDNVMNINLATLNECFFFLTFTNLL